MFEYQLQNWLEMELANSSRKILLAMETTAAIPRVTESFALLTTHPWILWD